MIESSGKLVKETAAMAVYHRLNELFAAGKFQIGEWIREREIKELLGVSSTPIREALRMLVQERILESVPHHGVRLRRLTLKEIRDFYELRAELEGLSAELAAKRGDKQKLEAIGQILDLARANLELELPDEKEAVRHNNEFHHAIAAAGDNHALINSLSQLRATIHLLCSMSWSRNKQRRVTTLHQHQEIFAAITARDPELARKSAQEHIWDSSLQVLNAAKELEAELAR
ncbi:GntR family transcriptional regulator [Brevibacillus massiliensis]|jgi:DNA-binding GntR family transcriptional regulator|uniref:GntR family transcriptional regulator n=1 Tax=Brevibacillus massiliensis TaxID=1118054 RepID=UPI0002DEF2B7|nr:GntR family transcriptional regulator [Brevibacillus massiliensis]